MCSSSSLFRFISLAGDGGGNGSGDVNEGEVVEAAVVVVVVVVVAAMLGEQLKLCDRVGSRQAKDTPPRHVERGCRRGAE